MRDWLVIAIGIGFLFAFLPNVYAQENIPPPLKQFKSGIPAINVKCNQGFQLMIRNEDGEPACVKPESVGKLDDRGWGVLPLRGLPTSITQGNFTNSTPLGNNTLPASFMSCDTPYPQNGTGVAVLYMPVNSIGKICLKYYNPNDFPLLISQFRVFDPTNNYQNSTNITTWSDVYNSTISKGYFFEVYWIKTGNQTGFYGMNVPSCAGTPFAVGYDNNSRIVANDFPFVGVTVSCASGVIYPEIDSTTGIGVKYIPYP